jgi:hypothetical protein
VGASVLPSLCQVLFSRDTSGRGLNHERSRLVSRDTSGRATSGPVWKNQGSP